MIIRWGIKLGLAGGAVYYLSEQGVWKDAVHSEQLCKKISTSANPYTSQIKANLPFEIPNLPRSQKISYLATHYWNAGVMWTFSQLANLPSNLNKWTSKGLQSAKSNPELKKFFDSFSGSGDKVIKESK